MTYVKHDDQSHVSAYFFLGKPCLVRLRVLVGAGLLHVEAKGCKNKTMSVHLYKLIHIQISTLYVCKKCKYMRPFLYVRACFLFWRCKFF